MRREGPAGNIGKSTNLPSLTMALEREEFASYMLCKSDIDSQACQG